MARSYEFLKQPEDSPKRSLTEQLLEEQRRDEEKIAKRRAGIDIEAPAADDDKKKRQQREIKNRRNYGIYQTTDAPESKLDKYGDSLGLDYERLRGKMVLDIGAGQFLQFAQEAAAQYDIKVVSVNPELAFSTEKFYRIDKEEAALKNSQQTETERRQNRYRELPPQINKSVDMHAKSLRLSAQRSKQPAVAAYVQELPFADASFDCEVSLNGVPGYLPEFQEEYDKAFSEVIRTLKPGGEARFFPIDENIYNAGYFKELMEKLKDAGHQARLEPVVNKRMRLIIIKKTKKE